MQRKKISIQLYIGRSDILMVLYHNYYWEIIM